MEITNQVEKTKEPRPNVFFMDLIQLMKNEEFKYFYNTYFTDWNEIQSMVFFMKLYSSIEYEYDQRFHKTISDTEMSYMLQQIMTNTNTRKMALQMFNDYQITVDYQKTKQFRTLLVFNKSTSSEYIQQDNLIKEN